MSLKNSSIIKDLRYIEIKKSPQNLEYTVLHTGNQMQD